MTKTVNKEGEAALLEVAKSVGAERIPWLDPERVGDALKSAISDAIQAGVKDAGETFADEIIAWVMETTVEFGRATGDDIIIDLMSDCDVLYSTTLLDSLLLEVDIMDDADDKDDDATEHRDGLSSREYIRQKIVKTLRSMADRVENYQPKN